MLLLEASVCDKGQLLEGPSSVGVFYVTLFFFLIFQSYLKIIEQNVDTSSHRYQLCVLNLSLLSTVLTGLGSTGP